LHATLQDNMGVVKKYFLFTNPYHKHLSALTNASILFTSSQKI